MPCRNWWIVSGDAGPAARFGLPIHLSELGASAGLNLMWDHFALRIGHATFGPDTPALTLRLWPDDLHIPLGRADFHGRWVIWDAP
ncbi:DUF2332 family protein [Yoonia sp.]|uniref:DUF2332 family protein n=1 Tax=Yoonia sp. TaxID=2212373 RepID=UPI0034506A1B